MEIDTERIISEVQQSPCLWDITCAMYKNRDARQTGWLEVCRRLFSNFDDMPSEEKRTVEQRVIMRWKGARDAYTKCKSSMNNPKLGPAAKKNKKYIYYEKMTFLNYPNKYNAEYIDNDISPEETLDHSAGNSLLEITIDTTNNLQETSQRKKRQKGPKDYETEFERRVLAAINKREEKSDDMSFFESLLPIVKEFSNCQKLLFRSQVLNLAMNVQNMNSSSKCDLQDITTAQAVLVKQEIIDSIDKISSAAGGEHSCIDTYEELKMEGFDVH